VKPPVAPDRESRPSQTPMAGIFVATAGYAALVAAFWLAARHFQLNRSLDGHFPSAFASFVLLFAPYWFFGFGLADRLRAALHGCCLRVLAPALLVAPYLVFSLPQHAFRWQYAVAFVCLPAAVAALFEFFPPTDCMSWQDLLVLLAAGLPVEFGWLRGAWPQAGLGAMAKLLLMDAVLYAFLVVRRVSDAGHDLRPRWRDLVIGMREWVFFAPFGIGLGLVTGFIRLRAHLPQLSSVAAGWLITFFFVALPEELFFRGLLQNLLEKRLLRRGHADSRLWALLIASSLFGLSHFNKPGPFNSRYVFLATIAGVFYGRAWRDRRRLFCSAITHTTVDVIWSVWFR
jgi:membrane protease YdiL (CAAX protease family)